VFTLPLSVCVPLTFNDIGVSAGLAGRPAGPYNKSIPPDHSLFSPARPIRAFVTFIFVEAE